VNKSEFSINEVLGDIGIVFVQHLEQLKRTNLTIHLDTALPDKLSVIESDIYIFKQVISNLIENAIKYTHSGSIHFGYLPPVKNEVTFYIKDTGIGISTENQAVIFEHFRQADIENRSQYGGTGLGLAICKGALAHIGGKIWVESKPGEGSVFYFTLPFHQLESVTGGNQSLVHEGILNEKPGNHCKWPGKHILIVEDEQTNMEFLKIILGKTQADITSAENALTLRNYYQKLDQFDLVLLDVRLPDASGWDLAREIKAIMPGLPVIAQTAYAMSSDLQKSMSAGCDNFISKPINKAKLLTMLSEYLG
jgi:CheY-like chemotaxis protein